MTVSNHNDTFFEAVLLELATRGHKSVTAEDAFAKTILLSAVSSVPALFHDVLV